LPFWMHCEKNQWLKRRHNFRLLFLLRLFLKTRHKKNEQRNQRNEQRNQRNEQRNEQRNQRNEQRNQRNDKKNKRSGQNPNPPSKSRINLV